MQTDPRYRLRSVISLLAFLLFAASSLAADTRLTVSPAQLHVAPRAGSRVVAVVPAGVQLSVSSCSTVWCTTSWNGAGAWVAKRDLVASMSGQQGPKRAGKGHINSDGQRIPSPRPSTS